MPTPTHLRLRTEDPANLLCFTRRTYVLAVTRLSSSAVARVIPISRMWFVTLRASSTKRSTTSWRPGFHETRLRQVSTP